MIDEPPINRAQLAIRGLEAKLRDAIRAAWIDGKNFAIGPLSAPAVDNPFAPQSIFEPVKMTVECKAGPVDPVVTADELPQGFTLYVRPDFTPEELRRFRDGRHDWRDSDWQDHCGLPGCELCERGEVASHAIPDDQL